MHRTLILGLVVLIASGAPVVAQSSGQQVLVTGVDINGTGFPLVLIDLTNGTTTTLATFANRPVCPPTTFPQGQALLYELVDTSQSAYIYHVNVGTRERTAVTLPADIDLTCPRLAPHGNSIAWLAPQGDGSMDLVTTAVDLTDAQPLVTHPTIYDVQWSPGGGAMVYHITSDDVPFPVAYSLVNRPGAEPRQIWSPAQGLLSDYRWVADSSGLLVTYYTDEHLAVALLPTDCIIGPGDPCLVVALAVFPASSYMTLLNAFSPFAEQAVVSVQSEQGETDLFVLDLSGQAEPRQLTFSPDIAEAEAFWSVDGSQIFFIGGQVVDDTGAIRGKIYSIPADGSEPPTIVFESTVFSPSSFLWWYE